MYEVTHNYFLTLFNPSFLRFIQFEGGHRGPDEFFLENPFVDQKLSKKVSRSHNMNHTSRIKVTASQSCRIIIQSTPLIFRAWGHEDGCHPLPQ